MMEHSKLVANFQTLNAFLSELQNNMNSAIPEIYLKLQEQDNKEVGQSFLSNLFWTAFDLIGSIEALPQRELISWVLGAFVESIHDNLQDYPNLNENISSCYERLTETITTIKDKMIAPVVSYPDQHINDVWTYKNNVVKVADFDTFDFVYASVPYNEALTVVSRECKAQVLKKCFPYDKWKIGFWFGESPQFSPCKQCNWGCDEWVDTRGFVQDESQPILDYNGNILANDVWQWITYLVKQEPSRFYVVESVSDKNARFGTLENDWKDQHPNGAFINEYCLVWGRDDFLNDWVDFDDSVGSWMFRDDGYGTIVNENGFIDRSDFYRNWGLDASECMFKPTPRPPDPNL
jgi:hypothetical protein